MLKTNKISSEARFSEHLRAHGAPAFHLNGERRGRILEESRRARMSLGSGQRLGFHRIPVVSLTAAAVAFLILSAGFMAQMPGVATPGPLGPMGFSGSQVAPSAIWADYRDGQVILSWKGEENRAFAVRQGTQVTQARAAQAVRVEGTRFIQPAAPAANGAVFYVVE